MAAPKKTNKTPGREPVWLTRTECARLFGVGVKQFDSAYRLGGTTEREGPGRSIQINATAHVAARLAAARGGDLDLLDDGSDSPALEKGRYEKYLILRAQRRAIYNQTLERDQVHAVFGTLAQLLRGAGDRLQREYGADAYDVLNEAITAAESAFRDALVTEEELASDDKAESEQ